MPRGDKSAYTPWRRRAGESTIRDMRSRITLWSLLSALLLFSACGEDAAGPAVRPPEPGMWIVDSNEVLDEFPFRTDACEEVFPSGSSNHDSVPPGSAAWVRLRSTACYRLTVRVVDSDSDTVRTFETRFGIYNRSEEEKNRGVLGFAPWDGRDDAGKERGSGRYLWRMEFDFGLGRIRRFRADILIP